MSIDTQQPPPLPRAHRVLFAFLLSDVGGCGVVRAIPVRARLVIALVPARVGTRWWRENVVGSGNAVFLPSRLRFDDGKNTAPFDAALVFWGASADELSRVLAGFEGAWMASCEASVAG
jgi:hypothetical protein